ncbi:MAG: EAL domain-containing protein [Actinomycetota bacterium]|nr:EAL domain-containing protein [Actinomycetota bacterium]
MTTRDDFDYAAIMAAVPDPVIIVDPEINLKYLNSAAVGLLGWDPTEWLGRSLLALIHPDDVAVVISSANSVRGKASGTPIELRMHAADGTWKWVEVVGGDATGAPGVDGYVVVARDVTQRRMWEVASGDTVRFQQAVQHAKSIMLLLDRGGCILSVNGAFTRLLGHDPSVAVGSALASFSTPVGATELADALGRSIETGRATTCEVLMRHVDPVHEPRPIRFEIVNLLDDPVVACMVVTAHDVSDLHTARMTLEHLARHDVLTGLVNRSVLLERLESVVEDHRPTAVIFIDLDRFKPVNDLLGHEAGDELLRLVGERLRLLVRPDDLVARVGGDEFVVLADGVNDRQTAQQVCDRIDAALAEPYLLADGPMRITASVGVALNVDDATVTGLMADADLAMYEAKAGRRGEPVRSIPSRQRSANERRRLADDLAVGLRRGEVVAYLQPVTDITTGRTVGLEALARWHHPNLGVLRPAAFLDLAEDAGLDSLLGDVVLRSMCETASALPEHFSLGINLSVPQLADAQLCERISTILGRYGIASTRLVVEITEHATLTRRAGGGKVSPERTLMELHEMGARLSLDDFGTGFSSLTHIRMFPLHAIKIDQSFVAGVCTHQQDRAVIGAVVGMSKALDLLVVAEGVETLDQLEALRELGCDLVQGHLISLPLAPAQVAEWLRRHGNAWPTAVTNTRQVALNGGPAQAPA